MGSSGRGKALDVKLQIRYHGLKATQYFSKYTSQSEDVFRHDLTTLKLPHPKKTNITFVSYGCVECVWTDVISGAVLHKNLTTKTSPPTPDLVDALRKILEELSIVKLGLKETYHGVPNRRPQQRPYQDSTVPFPIMKKRPYQELLTTTDSGFSEIHNSESARPFKYPRIENPVYTNLPTNPVIQSQSQRNRPFPYPSREPTQHDGDKLPAPSTGSLSDHLAFLAMSDSFSHPRERLARVKHSKEIRQDTTDAVHRLYGKPANILHEGPITGPVQTTNLLPSQVHNARPSSVTIANQIAAGKRRKEGVFSSQKSLTKNPANNSFNSLPKESETMPIGAGTMAGRLALTEHNENATNVVPPLASFPLPPALPAAAASNNDTPLRIKQEELSNQLDSPDTIDMARRKIPRNSRTVTSEHTAEIQRLTRESWDVKRQLTAAINREKVITSELKKLGSDWVPEPTIISDNPIEDTRLRERLAQLEVERTLRRVQPDKDVTDRVAELEAQLNQERKLREQAENAIADIRRECRAPFVVPSLLDAFRQISELTTRAMEP